MSSIHLRPRPFIADHVQDDFCHSTRLAIAASLENDVLHLAAAQMFYSLFS